MLRTTVVEPDGVPCLRGVRQAAAGLPVTDIGHLPEALREAEARRFVRAESRRPFILEVDRPYRARLVRPSRSGDVLQIYLHQQVADGVSHSVFANELGWQARLDGALAGTSMVTDRARPGVPGMTGERVRFTFEAAFTNHVWALVGELRVTPYVVLSAVFAALVCVHSRQKDVVVMSSVDYRERPDHDDPVGLSVNSMPLRLDMDGDPTFVELGWHVRLAHREAQVHLPIPIERLVDLERRPPFLLPSRSPSLRERQAHGSTWRVWTSNASTSTAAG